MTNAYGMTFIAFFPGDFVRGSPDHEKHRHANERQHTVKLTKGFYLQTTPVTQSQWSAIMETTPSYFGSDNGNRPVEHVSWLDCQQFIQQLNLKEPRDGYRLPTEAEWEYACRSGTHTRFYFGEKDSLLADHAWYYENSNLKTQSVAQKAPNPSGLYDLYGNVWEWCEDWYGDYPDKPATDPSGPPEGIYKVVRGGAWYFYADTCRSAARNYYLPSRSEFFIGFRLVRNL